MDDKTKKFKLRRQKKTETELAKRTGYEALGSAIISRAIKDYKWKNMSRIELYRIRKFFHSQWFKRLSNLDPDFVIRKLDEYRREHGYIVIDDIRSGSTDSNNTDSAGAVGITGSKKG